MHREERSRFRAAVRAVLADAVKCFTAAPSLWKRDTLLLCEHERRVYDLARRPGRLAAARGEPHLITQS